MHSYKSLAVLALAVSTASTAYSAPVQESQQQARSVIGTPLNVGRDELSKRFDFSAILDQLHHHLASLLPAISRDTVDLDQRASISTIGNVASDIFHSGLFREVGLGALNAATGTAASVATNKFLNSTRRDFPLDLSDCWRPNPDGAGVCNQPSIERDDVSTRDVIDALQFLKRQLIELD